MDPLGTRTIGVMTKLDLVDEGAEKGTLDVLERVSVDIQGPFPINNIDGTMNAKKKKTLIRNFEEQDKAVLTSCRVLNEGVNIIQVDSVCFVESRNNSIDTVQCIGRALRLCNGKESIQLTKWTIEEW